MPTIPSVEDFGRRPVPRAARGQVVDRSGEIDAQSQSRQYGDIRNIVQDFGEREDRFAYGQARSSLLQADIEARKALENDQDWSTYESRYQESMGKAREKAAKLIRGNRDRGVFENESKLDVERGLFDVRSKARAKEGDWGRSTLDKTLEANRSAALSAKDEPTREALINSTKDSIRGAKEKGYIDESQATNAFQGWRDSYTTGSLSMLPAEDRIAALTKAGVADYLQPDVRAKLLEQAKNESNGLRVRRESQIASDAIAAKHGRDYSSALKAARQIKDPEVRDSTESRIKERLAIDKALESEHENQLTEQAVGFINGGGRFADIPLNIKNGLKPSQLSSLRSYAEQVAGGAPVRTNKETYIELSSMFANDPQKFGDISMLDYRDKLSDSDWEEFADLQRKVQSGNLDGKATGFKSVVQVRDDRMRELFGSATPKGAKAKKAESFVEQFEDRMKALREETGKPPKADDARKILDDLTAEVAINWGSDKRAFELTDEDVAVPQEDRNEIIRELRMRGKPVTDEAIVSLYNLVNAKK